MSLGERPAAVVGGERPPQRHHPEIIRLPDVPPNPDASVTADQTRVLTQVGEDRVALLQM